MLRGQFRRSCIFAAGLAAALVQSASLTTLGQDSPYQLTTGRDGLIELAYLDLPTTAVDEETSPSDSQTESDKAGSADKKEAADGKTKPDAARDSIAPVQNRPLSTRIQAVSISHSKIGTGLIPTPAASRPASDTPAELSGAARGMYHSHVYWAAPCIQHFPLYFEEAMLERHGHTRCWHGYALPQSVVSGVRFFATIPMLPYLETLRPKHDCVYALGHSRPGSAAPCLQDAVPWDAKAAIVESASAAAFFWAAPL